MSDGRTIIEDMIDYMTAGGSLTVEVDLDEQAEVDNGE